MQSRKELLDIRKCIVESDLIYYNTTNRKFVRAHRQCEYFYASL